MSEPERDPGTAAVASVATAAPASTTEIDASLDPYTAILELAERELQLARDGRIEDLRSLAPQWDALTAGLPEQPPASARAPWNALPHCTSARAPRCSACARRCCATCARPPAPAAPPTATPAKPRGACTAWTTTRS